ncbi:MAG: hypothetical protein RIS94_815 [Pseudomonadota bacterium]|jgi:hypothetical protein
MLLDWMKTAKTLAQDPVEGFDPDAVTVSEICEIAAPARIVWGILTDLPNYNAWNPFCIRAEGRIELGHAVVMTLINYAAPGSLFPNCEYISAIVPERQISWDLPNDPAWPYPARRDQVIEPTGPDSCRYFSTDAFLGQNGIHVFRFAGPWVKRAFDDTARALKARAEAFFAAEQKD